MGVGAAGRHELVVRPQSTIRPSSITATVERAPGAATPIRRGRGRPRTACRRWHPGPPAGRERSLLGVGLPQRGCLRRRRRSAPAPGVGRRRCRGCSAGTGEILEQHAEAVPELQRIDVAEVDGTEDRLVLAWVGEGHAAEADPPSWYARCRTRARCPRRVRSRSSQAVITWACVPDARCVGGSGQR